MARLNFSLLATTHDCETASFVRGFFLHSFQTKKTLDDGLPELSSQVNEQLFYWSIALLLFIIKTVNNGNFNLISFSKDVDFLPSLHILNLQVESYKECKRLLGTRKYPARTCRELKELRPELQNG